MTAAAWPDMRWIPATSLGLFLFLFALTLTAGCSNGEGDGSFPGSCPPTPGKMTTPPLGGGGTGVGSGGGGVEEVTSFGANPAGLKMYVHAPSGGTTATAVVLALHGCTQSASDYVGAGWNDVADKEGFVIVYGEQTSTNNSMKCFRWWDATQIDKKGGEAESLANMVATAQAKYGTKRAFVTGLSAGGAMTTVMLAAYPDVFEAGAIMAGLPYKCATSQMDAYTCMSGTAHAADIPTTGSGTPPRVSVWQGDADYTVRPSNRDEIVKQWAKANGVSEQPSETTTEGPAKHNVHRDANGVVRVESWTIAGMGHGVALDAKAGCGKAGAYELDVGLCSTAHAAAFFLGTSPRSDAPASPSASSPQHDTPCP